MPRLRSRLPTLVWAGWTLLIAASSQAADPPPIRFEEVGEKAGARFTHTLRDFGSRPKAQVLKMFTSAGSAVAVGDYDGDGFDDLFVTDSGEGRPCHLLHNNGDLTFTDVAAASGVAGGNGPRAIVSDALWLDYDNDGRLDLLVARLGTPILYRNEGPDDRGVHRFTDVGPASGLTRFGNTIAAIAFDYDNDGYLDLMLAHYLRPVNLLELETPYVLPNDYDTADNGGGVTLWHNVAAGPGGERRFVEVTGEAGLAHHTGWSADLGHADLNDDGLQDVYVSVDFGTDRLFLNRGDRTFEDVTEKAIGFDTRKGMNVDFGDFDRDGLLDIYISNITDEYMRECNMLWKNLGDGTFVDVSRETGTCDSDWGWGAKFADFDNDGWLDIFAVNGLRSAGPRSYVPLLLELIITPGVDFSDVRLYPEIGDMSWSGYQKTRLFHNRSGGTFLEIAAAAGVASDLDGRGIGVADFDNDGRLDLYQTNAGQPSLLYRGVTDPAGNWVQLKLAGGPSNRDGIGARVILRAGSDSFLREVDGGNGFGSQSTTRLHFGLGSAPAVDSVWIRWPSGHEETLSGGDAGPPVPINRLSYIVEGKGVSGR